MLLASSLLVGAAGATIAEQQATEPPETPAVETSPPEPATDAGKEQEAPEAEQSGDEENRGV